LIQRYTEAEYYDYTQNGLYPWIHFLPLLYVFIYILLESNDKVNEKIYNKCEWKQLKTVKYKIIKSIF